MATPSASIQAIISLMSGTGSNPVCKLDTNEELAVPLVLTDYKVDQQATIIVGPSDTDLAYALPAAGVILLMVLSDQPVSMRLQAGETLMGNGRFWLMVADDEEAPVVDPAGDQLLFTGNGSNEASVKIWHITANP